MADAEKCFSDEDVRSVLKKKIQCDFRHFHSFKLDGHISEKEIVYEYEKIPILEIYISYLRLTRDYLMYHVDLSFQTVVHLRKEFQSF